MSKVSPDNSSILAIRNVSKTFHTKDRDIEAIHNVSLTEQIHGTFGEVANVLPADFNKHLAVNLAEEGLLALEGQLRFLYDHQYVNRIFDIAKWADERFLKQAQEKLQKALDI